MFLKTTEISNHFNSDVDKVIKTGKIKYNWTNDETQCIDNLI